MTFIVRDLSRMEAILTTVLGARKVYDSGDETFSLSRERFFLVGGTTSGPNAPSPIWIAIMEGESLPSRTYNHVAFKISEADYPVCFWSAYVHWVLTCVKVAHASQARAGRSISMTTTTTSLNCIRTRSMNG